MSIQIQILLLLIVLSLALSKPLQIVNAIPETGPCHTSDWQVIDRGKWGPIEKCTKNCTCDLAGFLECGPWCDITYTVCNYGDKMTNTTFYEEIGNTGCRRCSVTACDAISLPETTEGYKEMHSKNKTPHLDGKYYVINETETIYERPTSDKVTVQQIQ